MTVSTENTGNGAHRGGIEPPVVRAKHQSMWFDPVFSVLAFAPVWLTYQLYNLLTLKNLKPVIHRLCFGALSTQARPQIRDDVLDHKTGSSPFAGSNKINQYMELLPAEQWGTTSSPRSLVLFYTWLMAKPQHVTKYTKLFTTRGIDVIKVSISPMDLMQPTTRAQVAARCVLEHLKEHPQYSKIMVYAFSVGAYAFAESTKLMQDMPADYGYLSNRFVGHIWDSPVDVPNMPTGVAKSVTKNKYMQGIITSYVEWFLRMRHDVATRHYYAASEQFHKGPVNAPGLYIYANNDPMSDAGINQKVIKSWEDANIQVTTNIFPKAPHCATFQRYPEEYLCKLMPYLHDIGMIKS